MVFAGPNGSGKSTITRMAKTVGVYINADDIKKASLCSDMEAALRAEKLREDAISNREDFTFETVLSTDRNLKLLRKAKENGYFVRCIYVLTANADINLIRVQVREASGGHSVPEEKIRARYDRALALIPQLVEVCDIVHIYDSILLSEVISKMLLFCCFRFFVILQTSTMASNVVFENKHCTLKINRCSGLGAKSGG